MQICFQLKPHLYYSFLYCKFWLYSRNLHICSKDLLDCLITTTGIIADIIDSTIMGKLNFTDFAIKGSSTDFTIKDSFIAFINTIITATTKIIRPSIIAIIDSFDCHIMGFIMGNLAIIVSSIVDY